MRIRELRDQRAKLLVDMRALVDKAETENRNLTDDEKAALRQMEADHAALGERIQRLEDLEAEERAARTTVPESQRTSAAAEQATSGPSYGDALRSWLRSGFQSLRPEEQTVLRGGYRDFSPEERAMSTLDGVSGGFTVAPDQSFYGRVVEAQKTWGGMFRAGCTELTTATGAELPIPTSDDTSNVAVIVGEGGSQTGGTNLSFAQVKLRSYLYSTKRVDISWQYLQDAAIDIEATLGVAFGKRLGRGQNAHLTTGTGGGQPQGVVPGSTVGRTAATGFTATIATDDLIRLYHAVNSAYRANAKWMFSDATALILRLLKDGEGRYIWQGGLREGEPDTLLGKPVIINDDMPTMATSAKPILFGDFANYHIRRVRGLYVVRADQIALDTGSIAFLAYERLDGALVDAGMHPIQHFANSSS